MNRRSPVKTERGMSTTREYDATLNDNTVLHSLRNLVPILVRTIEKKQIANTGKQRNQSNLLQTKPYVIQGQVLK